MSDQLTLEQSERNYADLTNGWRGPLQEQKTVTKIIFRSFKAGAEWQKEQLIDVLKAIAKWPGNLSDSNLLSRTGPNDAALRGNMVVTMRQIAIDVITKFEPDFKPYQD